MSLRGKLTISVALLVAVAIALSGWVAVDAASRELNEEVDAFLEGRVDLLASQPAGPRNGRGSFEELRGGFQNRPRQGLGAIAQDDSVTQVISGDGRVLVLGSVALPVSFADLAVASEQSPTRLRTEEVDGTRYRVITARLGHGNALMVARDLSEVDAALDGLTRRILVVGLVGAAVAALVAWGMASSLTRPIDRLTRAAEHVAQTQDLESFIEVDEGGEVGRLADSLNTMLDALDTSRQQQQRLVMDASHELRTPLTSLRTNVDLLRRAPDMSRPERDVVLGEVGGELEELTVLVTELVDSAMASRRPSEPMERIHLSELVATVADRAARRTKRNVRVHLTNGPGVSNANGPGVSDDLVHGQRALLERAVSNLVDNAIKFSAGDVDVEVDRGRVAVRDRGPGIVDAERSRIFDRFFRSVTTRSEPGSGLGLSIVKDIVASHGGQVFVEEPAEGPGAVVGFELPQAPC